MPRLEGGSARELRAGPSAAPGGHAHVLDVGLGADSPEKILEMSSVQKGDSVEARGQDPRVESPAPGTSSDCPPPSGWEGPGVSVSKESGSKKVSRTLRHSSCREKVTHYGLIKPEL